MTFQSHLKSSLSQPVSGFFSKKVVKAKECPLFPNSTELLLYESVDRCADPLFRPRIISPSMISWKSTNSEEGAGGTDETGDKGGADAGDSSSQNETGASHTGTPSEEERDRMQKRFLIVAIALPGHPPSADMYESLRIVSPMFPQLTTVIGNGYEFTNMCNQFSIKTFPKLLFFDSGILKGHYTFGFGGGDASFNPERLTRKIMRWGGDEMLPRATPTSIFKSSDHVETIDKLLAQVGRASWVDEPVNTMHRLLGPTVEPIAGSIGALQRYESMLFIFCAIYTFARFIYWLFRRCRTLSHGAVAVGFVLSVVTMRVVHLMAWPATDLESAAVYAGR